MSLIKNKRIRRIPLEAIDLDYDLWQLLSYTCRLITATSSKQLRKCKLSPEIAYVLTGMYRLKYAPMPIEIAKINKRKAQSITYLLGRMEKQGLIIKIRNENKRNTYKVLLTTKGRRASRNVSNLKVFHKIFGSFTEEKRKRFKKYLLELVNNCGFL